MPTDVEDLHLLDELVGKTAVEAVDVAPVAFILFAPGNEPLLGVLDRLVPLSSAHPCRETSVDSIRHVLHVHGHHDARARTGGKLLGEVRRQEAIRHEVPLLGGIVLNRAVGTVVVCHDQSIGRDE